MYICCSENTCIFEMTKCRVSVFEKCCHLKIVSLSGLQEAQTNSGPEVIKLFFVLNSAEHEMLIPILCNHRESLLTPSHRFS